MFHGHGRKSIRVEYRFCVLVVFGNGNGCFVRCHGMQNASSEHGERKIMLMLARNLLEGREPRELFLHAVRKVFTRAPYFCSLGLLCRSMRTLTQEVFAFSHPFARIICYFCVTGSSSFAQVLVSFRPQTCSACAGLATRVSHHIPFTARTVGFV